jgi:hypothetical protein
MQKKDTTKLLNIHFLLWVVIGSLLACILAVSLVIVKAHALQEDSQPALTATSTIPHVTDTERFLQYLHKALASSSAETVQSELKGQYADAEGGEQHMSFHYFGEVLYKVMGTSAFPLCKDWYGFGCHHGFLLDAIDSEGYEVVPVLDESCFKSNTRVMDTETCQHGIGHGLLEFSGRDPLEAIEACGLVADVFPKLGCASGVFMEYFSPTQADKHSRVSLVPTFDESDPLDVCDEFAGIRLATCLFEIHGWWEDVVHLPPRTVEAYCNSVEDKEGREFCLIGYGNFKGPYVAQARPYCDEFVAPESHALCRAGILWAALHHNGSPDPMSACSDLEEEYRTLCFEKGRFSCEVEGNCKLEPGL